MNLKRNVEFNLAPGIWEAYMRDKKTHKPLTEVLKSWRLDTHFRVSVRIPDSLKDDENAVIHIRRVR